MKTTVNLGNSKRIVINTTKMGEGVLFEIEHRDSYHNTWETRTTLVIDEAAAGALIFGMEAAFDAMGMVPMNAA